MSAQQQTYYLKIWNDIFNNFFMDAHKDKHTKQVIFNVNIYTMTQMDTNVNVRPIL